MIMYNLLYMFFIIFNKVFFLYFSGKYLNWSSTKIDSLDFPLFDDKRFFIENVTLNKRMEFSDGNRNINISFFFVHQKKKDIENLVSNSQSSGKFSVKQVSGFQI